jgi:predicted nucleotide-binding protein (sugar kinase/HSP70/actin superfamily)
MDMIFKLNSSGANVITIDMLENKIIDPKSNMLQKKMFWNFGRKAVGGTLQILDRGDIDGIIYLMSFGCGIDSFVADLVERRIRQNSNIPFIVLSIDEHSGEAGFNTRLEAFIDMIRFTQPQRYNSKKKIIST